MSGTDCDAALGTLAESIVSSWKEKVLDYDAGHPLSYAERIWMSNLGISDQDPLIAYGATLLVCCLSDSCAFCIQIGDGLAAAIGDEDFLPVADDPKCRMNMTTSLCQSDPVRSFRFWYETERIPMAIVLATDGVTNTFESRESFLRFCRSASFFPLDSGDLWPRLMWKASARSDASGRDDTSVGVVCRDCPELRAMKESAEAKYREIDFSTAVPARRRKDLYDADGMLFEICGEGVRLVCCDSGGEVKIPARIRCGDRVFPVAEIGSRSFAKTKAEKVRVPYTVERISPKAFFKCRSLKRVEFEGTPLIHPKAFFCCFSLRYLPEKARGPARRHSP
ncbi:MAG: protein phosphatase 2C domain-containing protein [Candidatus Methanomethylophilaceae archaeon]|nr:protein phosphatase 2C domain-containing protein [Candidatus Methanomethylophilaceae archaeon]